MTENKTKILEIDSVTKSFDGKTLVLSGCSMSLETGSICAVVGESGSGKTTLLRLIAGLERPDAGTITLDGKNVSSDEVIVSPQERSVGFVFQNFALFPHMTVEQNIGFGVSDDKDRRVQELLSLIEMEEFATKYPETLSGGQEQRVALARTLATNPNLLLLDEPFSNLDSALRSDIRQEIRKIVKKIGTSMIFITHDLSDALDIADEIVFLKEGRILGRCSIDEFDGSVEDLPFAEMVADLKADAERIMKLFD